MLFLCKEKHIRNMNIIQVNEQSGIPLIGAIAFGVIDRGSNLLQVRTITSCNLGCTFCSTDGGIATRFHHNHFIVDPDYMIKWIKEVIKLKDCNDIEINIDSVGEPTLYQHLAYLISEIKKLPEVKFISMQTNGTMLNKEKIKELELAGLNRINLSIHSLDEAKSKYLMGANNYKISDIKEVAKEIRNSNIQLNITPVWLPRFNDNDIEELIKFAKELDCQISIQKYEFYKYSRKEKKAKQVNWFKFYRKLEEWQKKYDIKLKFGPIDFKIRRTKRIPIPFKQGDIIQVIIKSPGWLASQMIAVAKNRIVTVENCNKSINSTLKVKITESKNSIFLAKPL